jgi:hypothetical protein
MLGDVKLGRECFKGKKPSLRLHSARDWKSYCVHTSLGSLRLHRFQPPKSPDSGDFEVERLLKLEPSFCLKAPQNGGFRGRRTSAMTDQSICVYTAGLEITGGSCDERLPLKHPLIIQYRSTLVLLHSDWYTRHYE